MANAVAREAKKVRQILNNINEAADVFNSYVAKVQQLIEYLLSLPEKVLKFLSECLDNLYRSLSKGFAELFTSSGGSSDISALTNAASEVQKTLSAAVETTGKLAESALLAASTAATAGAVVQSTKAFKI